MLKHPPLDQLHALGLYGMAKAFVEVETSDEAHSLGIMNGSASCSTGKPHGDMTSGFPPDCVMPNCVSKPASKM